MHIFDISLIAVLIEERYVTLLLFSLLPEVISVAWQDAVALAPQEVNAPRAKVKSGFPLPPPGQKLGRKDWEDTVGRERRAAASQTV